MLAAKPSWLHAGQPVVARSVGAHVRDAAAYVCWSLARAYDPADVAPAFALLAPALLATACYDREVRAQMRRSHMLDSRMPVPVCSMFTTESASQPHAGCLGVDALALASCGMYGPNTIAMLCKMARHATAR